MCAQVKLIILCFCLIRLHAQFVILEQCSTTANFTTGSQFQKNLDLLFRSFLSNGFQDGYFNASIGTSSNTVYGLVQCRGDVSTDLCQTCLRNKTVEITQRCPVGMEAILQYDYCYVRYSNSNFFSQVDTSIWALYNTANISADSETINSFNQQLDSLLRKLSDSAASKQTRYDYGTDEFTLPFDFTNNKTIYGMVQCNRDLNDVGCLNCLRSMITWIPGCCSRKVGALIYSTTCFIHYEIYPILAPQHPSPPSPPPEQNPVTPQPEKRTENENKKSTNVAAIIASVIASVFFTVICAFLIRRRILKERRPKFVYDHENMGSDASLQFDLEVIRTVTDNFSDANKLGEGGLVLYTRVSFLMGKKLQ